jgi:oxygen-dependent protoporphyrinogen oxidase
MTIAIVGGGISGLAAAFRLRSIAPDAKVVLLEAGKRLGGKVVTERIQGFTIEGGPDSFLTSKPRGIGLCRELGIETGLQGTRLDTRGAYVLRAGRLLPLPEGLTGLVPSRLEPLLGSELFSANGKARLQREPHIPATSESEDETLRAFVERRFGREAYERLIEPLMAGIYAGDGGMLSLAATFPQLRRLELEHGSVLRAMQAPSDSPPSTASPFLTPIDGMDDIVEALRARLNGTRLATGATVRGLRAAARGYQLRLESGEDFYADSVILATPAFATAGILQDLAPDAAAALAEIPFVSSATISLGYMKPDVPRLPRGHGYVVPRTEDRPVIACTWTSSKFEHRAPEGAVLLRCFVGRAGCEDALPGSDEELVSLARQELCQTLGIELAPVLAVVFRWPNGMPQYNLGHLERLARVDRELAELPNLALAGALRGVGIPDCVASGEAAAEVVAGKRPAETGRLGR